MHWLACWLLGLLLGWFAGVLVVGLWAACPSSPRHGGGLARRAIRYIYIYIYYMNLYLIDGKGSGGGGGSFVF